MISQDIGSDRRNRKIKDTRDTNSQYVIFGKVLYLLETTMLS